MIVDWRLEIVNRNEPEARRRRLFSPRFPIINHHSSFIIHHFRSGISLLEVLISIFVLSVGLLGVAALIPIGKLALIETNKSDRTGACRRAAIKEVRVRGMLDYNLWSPASSVGSRVNKDFIPMGMIAIDPLCFNYYRSLSLSTPPLGGPAGTIPRFTLLVSPPPSQPTIGNPLSLSQADLIFRWGDELIFDTTADLRRPRALARAANGYVAPYPPLGAEPTFTPLEFEKDGNFTWFLTVVPVGNELHTTVEWKKSYTVSVVICYKRVFDADRLGSVRFFTGNQVSPGGGTVELSRHPSDTSTSPLVVKENEWILLYASQQYDWYRAVSSIKLESGAGYLSLVGPDWCGGANATAVVIPGVTGVNRTVERVD